MSNFVDDLTGLPVGKSDLTPVPSGQGAYYVAAAEWQTVMQAMLDLRGYSWRTGGNDGAKGATGGGGGTVPFFTLPVGNDLLLKGSNNNTRDNPLNSIAWQNTGLAGNPIMRRGNPYLAGIGLVAEGLYFSNDSMVVGGVRTWKIIASHEQSGTLAVVLDGVERSSYEAFIQNGDFKPWMRLEASSRGLNIGGGGCRALAGNVVRTGGSTVTVTTVNSHRFTVGDALWRTQDPYTGNVSDLALFGAEATGAANVVVTGTPAYNVFTYTLAGSNGSSAGGILYSSETDVTFGRESTGVAAIRSLGTTKFIVDQSGPGPAPYVPFQLRGLMQPKIWLNSGGQAFDTGLPDMLVDTSSGNKTCTLPSAASMGQGMSVRVVNVARGTANTLTLARVSADATAGVLLNNANASYVLAAGCWADVMWAGSEFIVYKGGPA